jgi:hypothetical protein
MPRVLRPPRKGDFEEQDSAEEHKCLGHSLRAAMKNRIKVNIGRREKSINDGEAGGARRFLRTWDE